MASTWQLSGDYFETCSCDYVCPCILTNMAAQPTKGDCNFAMVFQIEKGAFQNVTLDGLSFAVLGNAPEIMGKGGWAVGLIVDDRATPEQQQAIATIASGQAGGPPAILSGVVGKFLGVEARPIRIQRSGLTRSVSIPKVLEQTCEGVASLADSSQPMYVDNTIHPANSRLALARATASHMHAFGLDWDDTTGRNNGHFAPFNWKVS
jgi:hypothetical protein